MREQLIPVSDIPAQSTVTANLLGRGSGHAPHSCRRRRPDLRLRRVKRKPRSRRALPHVVAAAERLRAPATGATARSVGVCAGAIAHGAVAPLVCLT
jgi:hypothetical protein